MIRALHNFKTAGAGRLSYSPPGYYRWKIFRQPYWLLHSWTWGSWPNVSSTRWEWFIFTRSNISRI